MDRVVVLVVAVVAVLCVEQPLARVDPFILVIQGGPAGEHGTENSGVVGGVAAVGC